MTTFRLANSLLCRVPAGGRVNGNVVSTSGQSSPGTYGMPTLGVRQRILRQTIGKLSSRHCAGFCMVVSCERPKLMHKRQQYSFSPVDLNGNLATASHQNQTQS